MKAVHTIGAVLTSGAINAMPTNSFAEIVPTGGGDTIDIIKLVISAIPVLVHGITTIIDRVKSKRKARKENE